MKRVSHHGRSLCWAGAAGGAAALILTMWLCMAPGEANPPSDLLPARQDAAPIHANRVPDRAPSDPTGPVGARSTLPAEAPLAQSRFLDLTPLDEVILNRTALQFEEMEQLNAVLPYDREIAARYDLPEKELATTPTQVLCQHFMRSPMRVWFHMYDNSYLGVARALRASATLSTLFQREDLIPAMVKMYEDTPLEPENMKKLKPALVSMSLLAADEFLLYPPVFDQVAGHEKEILRHLCDRYRRMTVVNASRPQDRPVYSAVFNTTFELARRLMEQLDPGLSVALRSEKDETRFFARIEERL